MVGLRKEVAMKFGIEEEDIELSMGMSADFENAVKIFLIFFRLKVALLAYESGRRFLELEIIVNKV